MEFSFLRKWFERNTHRKLCVELKIKLLLKIYDFRWATPRSVALSLCTRDNIIILWYYALSLFPENRKWSCCHLWIYFYFCVLVCDCVSIFYFNFRMQTTRKEIVVVKKHHKLWFMLRKFKLSSFASCFSIFIISFVKTAEEGK